MSPPSRHGFKCRLVYVVVGRRALGYDNEWGKGEAGRAGGLGKHQRSSALVVLLVNEGRR
jgi:hypothetical protein